jgi:prepilin-type N-terminal cleavage/methylation domain-containing protein
VNKRVGKELGRIMGDRESVAEKRDHGFSLLELMIVLGIMMIVAGFAVPMGLTSMRTSRLREAESDYANLLQMTRSRAVTDDRYYSVYIQAAVGTGPQLAYADIYPQNANGTWGTGLPPGGTYTAGPPGDPMVTLSTEATPQPQAAAPGTANLFATFCNSCALAIIKNTAPTWGPDGLPCKPAVSAGGTGIVCNSAGGPVAYVAYFQSATTQEWDAVTITPAGRIKTWYYAPATGLWNPFNQ